jgi:hypothetical protein
MPSTVTFGGGSFAGRQGAAIGREQRPVARPQRDDRENIPQVGSLAPLQARLLALELSFEVALAQW